MASAIIACTNGDSGSSSKHRLAKTSASSKRWIAARNKTKYVRTRDDRGLISSALLKCVSADGQSSEKNKVQRAVAKCDSTSRGSKSIARWADLSASVRDAEAETYPCKPQ